VFSWDGGLPIPTKVGTPDAAADSKGAWGLHAPSRVHARVTMHQRLSPLPQLIRLDKVESETVGHARNLTVAPTA
jgi:hypothetical protein